jgi:hypothetical protein
MYLRHGVDNLLDLVLIDASHPSLGIGKHGAVPLRDAAIARLLGPSGACAALAPVAGGHVDRCLRELHRSGGHC